MSWVIVGLFALALVLGIVGGVRWLLREQRALERDHEELAELRHRQSHIDHAQRTSAALSVLGMWP